MAKAKADEESGSSSSESSLSSSSSSNDSLRELKKKKEETDEDAFQIIRGANRNLGSALKTSQDTSKTLKKQGEELKTSLKQKKNIRETIGKSEVRTRDIKRAGHLVDLNNSWFDAIKSFFSSKRRHEEKVTQEAREEEAKYKAEEKKAQAIEDTSFSESEDVNNQEEIDALEETGEEDVDAELEKTLMGLQALRKDVRSQTQRIKAQTHASKEMKILDKDTKKRTKDLTEKVKKLE
ncbi:hypothetical protein NECID01_0299 [Nematocida sp. AWRm77]|nr:hypothetical protein NECID01_0299 [Nematocida sp. AWRm77]